VQRLWSRQCGRWWIVGVWPNVVLHMRDHSMAMASRKPANRGRTGTDRTAACPYSGHLPGRCRQLAARPVSRVAVGHRRSRRGSALATSRERSTTEKRTNVVRHPRHLLAGFHREDGPSRPPVVRIRPPGRSQCHAVAT
jgi:hypothetical protein